MHFRIQYEVKRWALYTYQAKPQKYEHTLIAKTMGWVKISLALHLAIGFAAYGSLSRVRESWYEDVNLSQGAADDVGSNYSGRATNFAYAGTAIFGLGCFAMFITAGGILGYQFFRSLINLEP